MTSTPRPAVPTGIDLLDPELFPRGEAHAVFARLRREAPVAWHPVAGRGGFWAVTRYRDVVRVVTDPAAFPSARGTAFVSRLDGPPDADAADAWRPPFLSLNMSDPPVHGKLRRLLSGEFAATTLGRLAPRIRALARPLVERAVEDGRCDFVEQVAAPLPVRVLCERLGFSPDLVPRLLRLSHRLSRPEDPDFRDPGLTPEESWRDAERELMELVRRLVAARRRARRPDLVSLLLDARFDGAPLPERDLLFYVRLLLETGHETIANALAGAALAFARHPEERERLWREPGLRPRAVEEVLRFASPVVRFGRFVAADVELGGVPVRAGERVVLFFPSANRDEAAFPWPERFDVARAPNDHVAFGAGPHTCLGAHLVRLELSIVLEELARAGVVVELAGEPEAFRSGLNAGLKRLPVCLRRAACGSTR
ncbi:MAG: cytochrome P450 [Planctomycetes bacterium]|nr:cytochrome P450 [Planctomycetota bacterium]